MLNTKNILHTNLDLNFFTNSAQNLAILDTSNEFIVLHIEVYNGVTIRGVVCINICIIW